MDRARAGRIPLSPDEFFSRRALVLLGKGGVGKTTLSAAFARLASRRAGRTLAMECDEAAPMAVLLGGHPSFTPREVESGLSAMVLEGRHALEEYLRLVVPRAVFAAVTSSRLFQYFVLAAPGLRELMMMGKLCYEAEISSNGRPRWDEVVLDAPASGHALNLLRMPFAARESFGESRVGREARNIGAMLTDTNRCALLQVTTPEPLALRETLETYRQLAELGLEVAAVFVNRNRLVSFTTADLARLRKARGLRGNPHLDYFAAVARAELARSAIARKALAALRAEINCPIFDLPDFRELSGEALVDALATELSGASSVEAART